MTKLRWGTVTDDCVSLESAMRAFAASNSSRVFADHIRGAWTEDRRYWVREGMQSTHGTHRALRLSLSLDATFRV